MSDQTNISKYSIYTVIDWISSLNIVHVHVPVKIMAGGFYFFYYFFYRVHSLNMLVNLLHGNHSFIKNSIPSPIVCLLGVFFKEI